MASTRTFLKAIAALVLSLGAMAAGAQGAFPDERIRIIVPWSPGGGADAAARAAAAALSVRPRQLVVVEN